VLILGASKQGHTFVDSFIISKRFNPIVWGTTMMQEQSIFVEALDKEDPGERAAFLARACASDPLLRQRIERLLQQHQQGDSFLDSPIGGQVGTADEPQTERPGAVIGPYKLLQQIGEGGMGVVYMAEQQQPLRRKVALKIIKPGMDSAQVIARFEAERQALALMDHQNIAKVFDAGTTESGRPYFVMELVHGVPITQYCDDHHLTPKVRLELFLPVCHAIQHAHQKGIIHRDLKPSNVLVCLYDGVAVPKVIDFGIAKATGQQLTERTMFTQFGSLVGTLEYMSPEQAEMSQLGIDTRSDVYSMGVLLYELLTGTTPLERHRLREAGFDEIRRLIREEDPPKPSTRLSTSGVALAAISAQRQTEPAKLTRLVRGELDWIVMKALEKDRNRRYESANSLARDVERYLCDEPVEACPPTAGYKLCKFTRKHKAGLATAIGFVALLILGTAVSAWQALRAMQAEAVAQANEHRADAHAAQAEQQKHEAKNERDAAQRQRDEVRALNEKLRRTLYTAHMNLAERAWEEADVPRVLQLLEKHRPKPGKPDPRNFEWHYLNRLCHADVLLTLKGGSNHVDCFNSVAFSADGHRLVGTTQPGGTNLKGVKAWHDPKLKVWDAQTGQELRTFTLEGAGEGQVFSPDGKRVASGCRDGSVKVWDVHTGRELLALKGAGGSPVFSRDSQRLASWAGCVKVWDVQTGQELLALQGHTGYILSMAFSPDGKRLTAATYVYDKFKDQDIAGELKVWDARSGKELLTIKESPQAVFWATFSPDSTRVATVTWTGRDGPCQLKVRDAQTGQQLLSFKLKVQSDDITTVAFSPDSNRLVTVDENSRNSRTPLIKVWDLQTGQETFVFQGHTSWIGTVAFSRDGKRLASSSRDRTLRIWDLETGQGIRTLKGQVAVGGWHSSLAFSPDANRLACAGDYTASVSGDVRVWNAHGDQQTLTLTGTMPGRVAFSPDLKHLAGVIEGKTVKLWDARTGQGVLTFKGHTNDVFCLAFSPDGKRLASGEGPGPYEVKPSPAVVKVWDAQTGQELGTLKGHGYPVVSVAFSPDGKRLASVSRDQTVKVWDALTGKELLSLKGSTPGGPWVSVAFSPDGKRLAGSGRVWDAQTGQELLFLKGTGLMQIFRPDGKRLVDPVTGVVYDAQTGKELLTLPEGAGGIIALSPDGKRLASDSGAGVKLWDAETGEEMLILKAPASFGGAAFSADGHRLATGATIWDATPLPEKP
jgi:WD40 repeat protein/serine/threonine protein kinase